MTIDKHETTTPYAARYASPADEAWILDHAGERVLVHHDPMETPDLEWTYGTAYPAYAERTDYNAPGFVTGIALLLDHGRGVVVLPLGNVHSMRTNAFTEIPEEVMP